MGNYDAKRIENQERLHSTLQDRSSTGRTRRWSHYKKSSLAVSKAFSRLEEDSLSVRIGECGGWLRFKACPSGCERRLAAASFCKARLCVLCQWRKSLVLYHQVHQIACKHIQHFKSDVPLLLTLTVPNVPSRDLKERIDLMQKSWHRLMNRAPVKRVCRAWFRSLEVTYNEARDDYHPHFHVLIFVPRNYFDKKYALYIERDRWLSMWQESTGLSEITQVDIRKVKKRQKRSSLASISAEVAKYATKPGDYIKARSDGLYEAKPRVVETLHRALKGRKLVALGGKFKDYQKALKQQDLEQADLVHIDESEKVCRCRICSSELLLELYRWHLNTRAYVQSQRPTIES